MFDAAHPDKGPFLRNLVLGERFIGYYLLRDKHLESFRDPTRGMFLTLILADRSGQLIGRVWEDAQNMDEELAERDVIKLDGEAEDYQGRLQVRVLRARPAGAGEYDLRDLMPSSRRDPVEMAEALAEALAGIRQPHLHALLGLFFGNPEFLRPFSEAPAAMKVHHAYRHGLLEHTLEMLSLAEAAIALYPDMDADLLRAGVLLHDIGKLREYEWALDIDMTDEGRLVGHVQLTDSMLLEALRQLPEFPPSLALRLRHMLLAHPGRLEFGAARQPMTLEAAALHHIDDLSTQMNHFSGLLAERPPGEAWTDFVRGLGRSLYGGTDSDLSSEESDPAGR
ncbi:MAG: HD domain-containing protein [Anaerolineae bacterium]|nr:MAG: HD domain-containing protein [Anaerolineae bacterium]